MSEPNRNQASFYICPSFDVFNLGIRRRKRSPTQAAKGNVEFPYNCRRTLYKSTDDVPQNVPITIGSKSSSTAAVAHGDCERKQEILAMIHESKASWWLGPGMKLFNDLSYPRPPSPVYLEGSHLDATSSTIATEGSRSCCHPPRILESTEEERSVSFSTIEVREYLRTLGDHPDACGPPVSIDWMYTEMESISVEEYEDSRGPRRVSNQMRMHPNIRRRVLSEAGVGKDEMKDREKQMKKIKGQRSRTSAVEEVLPFVLDVETTIQSAHRKWKRRSWRSNHEDIKELVISAQKEETTAGSKGLGQCSSRISPKTELPRPKPILIREEQ